MRSLGLADLARAVHQRGRVGDGHFPLLGQLLGMLIRHTPILEALSLAIVAHVVAMIVAPPLRRLMPGIRLATPFRAACVAAVDAPVVAGPAHHERAAAPPAKARSADDNHLAPPPAGAENLVERSGSCEDGTITASSHPGRLGLQPGPSVFSAGFLAV